MTLSEQINSVTAAVINTTLLQHGMEEINLIASTEVKREEECPSIPVATTMAQPEQQKKKKQKRAPTTVNSTTDSAGPPCVPESSNGSNMISADNGAGSSSNYSDSSNCILLLAGTDEIPVEPILPSATSVNVNQQAAVSDTVPTVLSKAATRMRKYRADHRHDVIWLAKEAERMRNMRAARKAEASGIRPEKPRAEKAARKKRERILMMGLEPVEKFNHQEYLRKEAERVRKYRALKQLDPEWKKYDSERMRLYRAKRKVDASLKALIPPLPLLNVPVGGMTDEMLMPLELDIQPYEPQHQLMMAAQAEAVKAEDTDSEDEAQV